MTTEDLDAARLLLQRLGLRPEDLLSSTPGRGQPAPTFDDYIRQLQAAVPAGTLRAYGPYWRRIVQAWGDRRINTPSPLEVRELIEQTQRQAVVRRNSRGGRSAAEHMVGALRALYRQARADGFITTDTDPVAPIAKPRRLPSNRRALPDNLLKDINRIAATTGNDPDLDTLILRLHIETACRRAGALALRPMDLDPEQCLVHLHEKGGQDRWQPVSPTLMNALLRHCDRGAGDLGKTERLLRYKNGQPITGRRYDYLWNRIGKHLPWAATQQVTAHWLRHTTLTWVERHRGYAIARAFAGHTDMNGNVGATMTYVRASLHEVAEALSAMTGEPHPLAAKLGVENSEAA
ncbi:MULTISPECIES: site-specific integrase [Nocardia]|uniref:Tyrosine-type recombinase/integrase n=1 Tax=Nocardia speluncae TaxID=419477 RepID=A0A846XME3_9NOCA|nr:MULTISPECIES: site-specific integrase [Nocardia]MBF6456069.1 tyrosine-type recombinase/integrase [Nocardia cyriacigeorgica]MBF6478032.1 tyrosine-type recombinase/integrase [Nocardia cyriacigeorgica]MBF6553191.1 tyrosine-type recombinase/integrase [Nocardia cyriacigeorgica]NKY34894.1 tyrosine-type recombinase/integrase [Nocardia speluncae]